MNRRRLHRYGRHVHGRCLLLARRLIEAGTRLVCVNWHSDGEFFWDTHTNNFNGLKRRLMPPADQGFAALLEDLSQRGMLDETLVVWVGEFGRSPRVNRQNAGREHHPGCYSAVLAGGGVRGGQVYGRSDRQAAYPAESPVSPADLTATIYHALGIPANATLPDREGRPVFSTAGSRRWGYLAEIATSLSHGQSGRGIRVNGWFQKSGGAQPGERTTKIWDARSA